MSAARSNPAPTRASAEKPWVKSAWEMAEGPEAQIGLSNFRSGSPSPAAAMSVLNASMVAAGISFAFSIGYRSWTANRTSSPSARGRSKVSIT